MSPIQKVAIFGASGNLGAPITAALLHAHFDVTIISRAEPTATAASSFPAGARAVLKVDYASVAALAAALRGHDAAVCAVGPAGIGHQRAMVDAAAAAGVRRFVVDDFGWGPDPPGQGGLGPLFPEFAEVHAQRRAMWAHAAARAREDPGFTWTGVTIGVPIDWAIKKFPAMLLDTSTHAAVIYDTGDAPFTGTTLAGVGQSVVGVLRRPDETANRFVRVLSLTTCQNELLRACEAVTAGTGRKPRGAHDNVRFSTSAALLESGRRKHREGGGADGTWRLDLVLARLYGGAGEGGGGMVAPSRGESDAELLGVVAETPEEVVGKALGLRVMF